jgi:phage-related minor tail protein
MDEEIERLVVAVRADTGAFARDVGTMRGDLEGPFAAGVDRAGRAIETTLLRAVRTGSLGFEDLRKVALSVLGEVAQAAVKSGVGAIGGRGGGGIAGRLLGALASAVAGRATGGPVSPGVPYLVGERGPELFVPTAAGRVETGVPGRAGRDVRVAITINAPAGSAPAAMAQSSRQVARAVRAALAGVE